MSCYSEDIFLPSLGEDYKVHCNHAEAVHCTQEALPISNNLDTLHSFISCCIYFSKKIVAKTFLVLRYTQKRFCAVLSVPFIPFLYLVFILTTDPYPDNNYIHLNFLQTHTTWRNINSFLEAEL